MTYTSFYSTQGFTEWSSSRTPSDVFTLLQTVYGAFDLIARRRRVFKVRVYAHVAEMFSFFCGHIAHMNSSLRV